MEDCVFCKIVGGVISAKKIYEDDEVLAFNDIRPLAPVHFMIIPKAHVPSLYDVNESHRAVLGKILTLAGELARKEGAREGFRTIINTGRVGNQEVYHVHIHVIGGPNPLGPMISRRK